MLIILNAMSSIGIKFIAHEFLKEFNSQIIDDHFVSFNPLQVEDKNGNIVYSSGIDKLATENIDLVQKIIRIDNELKNIANNEHYRNGSFQDFYFDYGITDYLKVDLWENASDFIDDNLTSLNHTDYNREVSYKKTLNNYNSRPLEIPNYVISGQFSKAIIERFQKDLGDENVLVINFLRNISSSTALHIEDEEYFAKGDKEPEDFHYLRLFESVLSSIAVMSVKNVINVKFEDLLIGKFIEVKDKKISLPNLYQSFNNYLTNWEKEKIIKTRKCTSDKINYFNEIFSDSSKSIDVFLECTKFNPKNEIIDILVQQIEDKKEISPICLHLYNGKYIVSSGFHKFQAYKKLGFQEVSVYDGTKTFNMNIEDLEKIMDEEDEYEYTDEDKGRILKLLPKNFFVALGYQPLTYSLLMRRPR